MPFPSLDVIPAFVAVMDTGSLSGAARALGLAQPTVRRHIETLETSLQAQLFTRATNGLTPTAMALQLLPHAQAVLDEAASLHRSASATPTEISGTVRVTTSRVVATHVMPLVLKSLFEKAPKLQIELAATDQTQDLLHRAADIALRFATPTQAALVVQKLPAVQLGLFASDSLAATGDPNRLPFIADDRDDLILPGLAALGMPPPSHVVFRSDDALAQIAAIQQGLGVGICQSALAARLGLVRVLPKLCHEMPAYLVMHQDQSRIQRIRFVFDHLKETLPEVL